MVKGSLFSPTAIPNELITHFLCDIATFLDPKNPIAQLMPGVSVDATHPNFPYLRAFNDDDIDALRYQFLKPSTVFGNLGLKSAGVQLKIDALDQRRTIFFDKLNKKVLSRQLFAMLRLIIKDNLQIARQVAEDDEYARAIMPEIDVIHREFIERLENVEKYFVCQTHDLKTLIPISILTSEPFSDFNPYSENFKKITDSELVRIYQHSELTREIHSVEKNIEDFPRQSHDLYSKLKK